MKKLGVNGLVASSIATVILGVVLIPSTAAAQDGVLYVTDNKCGIGRNTPSQKLEIYSTAGDARVDVLERSSTTLERTLFKLENKGFPRFVLEDSNAAVQWLMAAASGGTFRFNKVGSGVIELSLEGGGNMTIGGSLTEGSSRGVKEAFEDVDGRQILQQVAGLPISRWSYTHDGSGVRHLGPMAEDFYAEFGLGKTEKGIATLDTSGVALAAIQGLNQVIEEKEARILELEERLNHLETLVNELASR